MEKSIKVKQIKLNKCVIRVLEKNGRIKGTGKSNIN